MASRRTSLAARRLAVGLSQEAVAEAVDVSLTSVARWERGAASPTAKHRVPLAKTLQVTTFELDRMLTDDGPPVPLNGHAVPPWMSHYVSLEQGAARLQIFEPITLPGLLQTAAYAEAVMRTNWMPIPDDDVQEQVEARLARQAVLDRGPRPLELCCVIDESALNRVTGTAETMHHQLHHLVAVAARPTVQLQIFPADGSAVHMAWFGAFHLFTSEGATMPFMCCGENLSGINYQDSPHAIEAHTQLFDYLSTVALPPDQSAELIQKRAERYQ